MGSLVPLELKIVGLASQQSVITSGAEDKEKTYIFSESQTYGQTANTSQVV